MYVWLCWVFISVRGLSLVVASGGHSSSRCGGHSSSQCAGLSLSRPLVAEHRLQTHRLSNCGSRAELLRGMWDLPRPGLEPVSPALAGRFSTTAPPGKPCIHHFYWGLVAGVRWEFSKYTYYLHPFSQVFHTTPTHPPPNEGLFPSIPHSHKPWLLWQFQDKKEKDWGPHYFRH